MMNSRGFAIGVLTLLMSAATLGSTFTPEASPQVQAPAPAHPAPPADHRKTDSALEDIMARAQVRNEGIKWVLTLDDSVAMFQNGDTLGPGNGVYLANLVTKQLKKVHEYSEGTSVEGFLESPGGTRYVVVTSATDHPGYVVNSQEVWKVTRLGTSYEFLEYVVGDFVDDYETKEELCNDVGPNRQLNVESKLMLKPREGLNKSTDHAARR